MALSYSYTAHKCSATEGLQHLSKQTCPAHMSAESNQKRAQSSCTMNSFMRQFKPAHQIRPLYCSQMLSLTLPLPVHSVRRAMVYIKTLWAEWQLLVKMVHITRHSKYSEAVEQLCVRDRLVCVCVCVNILILLYFKLYFNFIFNCFLFLNMSIYFYLV